MALTKGSGATGSKKAKDNSPITTVTTIKATGATTSLTDRASTRKLIIVSTTDSLNTVSIMAKESWSTLTATAIKAIMKEA